MKHPAYRPAANQGFTLIEIVITIVILGGVSLILLPFFNAITHGPDPVIRERAISLGQAMMDEIMAKKWDQKTPMGGGPICTGESPSQIVRPTLIDACVTTATPATTLGPDGETRTDFNDVDDYNGLSETDTFTDQDGATTTLTGFSRRVTVRYIASNANPIDQNTPAAAGTTDTKLVVVTVTSPLGETFYFVAVACNI
ncbi:MAG: type IV pilus modification PilV family protein [Desulfurivibrionaceae bacterium]